MIQSIKEKAKNGIVRVQNAVMLKNGGCKLESGDHLIEVLGTIIVAVFLLFIFRNSIANIFNNATASTETKLNSMFN